MEAVLIVALVFGTAVLALVVIGGTILMAIKIIKGGVFRENRKQQADEARMIQEIYLGLSQIEERVEALETIILDHDRKDRK